MLFVFCPMYFALFLRFTRAATSICRTIPVDAAWPSRYQWDELNTTVNGRLIETVPIAIRCHDPYFDEKHCQLVQENWHDPAFHEQSASSIQAAAFANRTCDPFAGHATACQHGNYVSYSVNAQTIDHVIQTVKFARKHNIRFVVRNTAHDYMGKSTGHGALAIWTHHLTWTNWTASYYHPLSPYTGPSVKAHAGVSVEQIITEGFSRSLTVIAGDCPTVGYSGGFIQGGGHGPLSTLFGMAADDVLEYEVVTTSGEFLIVTPYQYSDLFWALSGGGGGTYAIVWSVTVKAHRDLPTSGAVVQFAMSDTVTLDTFWAGVNAYRRVVPNITAAGGYTLAIYMQGAFQLWPMLLPNSTEEQARSVMTPFLTALTSLRIPYKATFQSFEGYLPAYKAMFNTSVFAVANAQIGGRLLLRESWTKTETLTQLNDAIRNIVNAGAGAYDIGVQPGARTIPPDNAVLPQWREAQTTLSLFLPWNDTGNFEQSHAQQQKITNVYMPSIKAVTPGSGAYLNEGDAFDPDWKQTFYGINYNRLLSIKMKYDPDEILYGSTAVGGDRWTLDQDSRLCRVIFTRT